MKIYIYLLLMFFLNNYGFSQSCDDLLNGCNTDSEYCTFGLKWGESPQYSPSGGNVSGPGIAGGTLTFTFMKAGHTIRTHSEEGIVSKSFENHQLHCAKEQIRKALAEYSIYANIDFQEVESESADIRFYAASLQITAVAFPKLPGDECADLSGQVVLNSGTTSCHEYFLLALHEIGHVLGLGHVTTDNVMKQGIPNMSFKGLQSGDIAGIRSIYGVRSRSN